MSTPVQKLLRLLSADQAVELRRAAALVLPEIAAKDEEVAQALQDALKDEDGAVRIAAIRAIGRLHIDKALPELLTRVQRGGEEAPPAAQAAANLGARGTKALRELMSG
ncbi:MAG: HEAT repeat domain-containing protein, partial [Gemmataceae bacterium]